MMKKILALLCAVILLAGLAACGEKSSGGGDDSGSDTDTVSAATMEEVFDKAFEAAKAYDADKMGEVDYVINFKKNTAKEENVAKISAQLDSLGEERLAQYREYYANAYYKITEQEAFSDDDREAYIAELSESYSDTDSITEIVTVSYDVYLSESDEPDSQSCVMIRVGEQWYRYLGYDAWDLD